MRTNANGTHMRGDWRRPSRSGPRRSRPTAADLSPARTAWCSTCSQSNGNGRWTGREDRALYIEAVAAIDLDAQAAPQIAQWLRERLESDEPVEAWIALLRGAFGGAWGLDPMPGAPALLRALCETPETEQVANALLSERAEPPTSVEAVIEVAHELEERLEEKAWRRRRRAKMTADEPSPIETC